MRFSAATARKQRYIIAVMLALVTLMTHGSVVSAAPTLQAIICGDTPATLTITRPESDSVLNESEIVLTGSVSQSSQLEVYVDDAFNGVESLPATATDYETKVQLAPGTHTIRLVAVDNCQVGNGTASVVVTYQPISTPSVGGQITTDIPDTMVQLQEISIPQGSVFERYVTQPLITAGRSLNLVTNDTTNGGDNYSNILRFLIILAGLLMIGFAGRCKNKLVAVLNRVAFDSAIVKRVRRNGRKAIMIIGAVIIVSVFIF